MNIVILKRVISGIALLLLGVASPCLAQGKPEMVDKPLLPVGVIGSPGGSGPLPAVAEAVSSLRSHTLYHPADMPGGAMPLVVWGNGACVDNGLSYAPLLKEIASHGYFVISLGYPRMQVEGMGRTENQPNFGQSPQEGFPQAIAWADQETARAGGSFEGHIDTSRIAVMGYSCGGVEAIKTAADPRVTTLVAMNSGLLGSDDQSLGENMNVPKSALAAFHTPVLYLNGGPTDIAYENASDDVSRIDGVPLAFINDQSGHGGTYLQPNGGRYGAVVADWLDWQLKGDKTAANTFKGLNCGLCRDPEWTVQTWRLD